MMTESTSPESLFALGQKAYKDEDYQSAAQYFNQAALDHESAGNPLLAAEMRNNCSVARLKGGDAKGALEIVTGSEEVFAQAGERQKQAMALGNQAAALEALHRYEEALQVYLVSNQILKELDDHELRPYVLQSISGLQLRTGRQVEALVSSEVALELKKKLSLRERALKGLLGVASKLMKRS